MTDRLPERVKRLNVTVGAATSGELLRESQYVFRYERDDAAQPSLSLLMPPSQAVYADGDLFPVMDMNLPEGFLFQRIVERFPKQPLTKMHLLVLMGSNGIGRIGYGLPEAGPASTPPPRVDRRTLLQTPFSNALFDELVDVYLAQGLGISGVQPKITVPTRTSLPIPDLIVKTAGPEYPGLAANEFLCLSAAREAGIRVPGFELSDDGQMLLVHRFDLDAEGRRFGFEDIAALMTLRVHDRLSSRKYQGSYEAVAEVVALMSTHPAHDLAAFFEQLAFSVMVRNGDAHLKNYAMLYRDERSVELAPMFDVVTTSIYEHERPGGGVSVDRTLALKWRRGKAYQARGYPTVPELLDFGRQVCRVARPAEVIERIAEAMSRTLADAAGDARIPPALLERLAPQWAFGQGYTAATSGRGRRTRLRT